MPTSQKPMPHKPTEAQRKKLEICYTQLCAWREAILDELAASAEGHSWKSLQAVKEAVATIMDR